MILHLLKFIETIWPSGKLHGSEHPVFLQMPQVIDMLTVHIKTLTSMPQTKIPTLLTQNCLLVGANAGPILYIKEWK